MAQPRSLVRFWPWAAGAGTAAIIAAVIAVLIAGTGSPGGVMDPPPAQVAGYVRLHGVGAFESGLFDPPMATTQTGIKHALHGNVRTLVSAVYGLGDMPQFFYVAVNTKTAGDPAVRLRSFIAAFAGYLQTIYGGNPAFRFARPGLVGVCDEVKNPPLMSGLGLCASATSNTITVLISPLMDPVNLYDPAQQIMPKLVHP